MPVVGLSNAQMCSSLLCPFCKVYLLQSFVLLIMNLRPSFLRFVVSPSATTNVFPFLIFNSKLLTQGNEVVLPSHKIFLFC